MWHSRAGAGTLVIREGRVLMVRRERSGRVRWELPSGFLEGGETFEAAAARETHEETGIRVEVRDLICTATMIVPSEAYRAVNLYFRATSPDDQEPRVLSRGEPIKKAAFVDVDMLNPREIHPVDRRILSRWRRNPHNESAFCFTIIL